jgi:UDP-2,3-diacylglucosamine hydrolase
MDVTPEAVTAAFEAAGVLKMIHGHTHRPGTHRHSTALGEAERVVLAAWDAQGEYLEITPNDWRRKVVSTGR